MLVGLATAVGLDLFAVVRFPELRSEGAAGWAGYVASGVVTATVLVVLAGYACLAFTATRASSPEMVVARRYGLVAGGIAGSLLVAASVAPNPVLWWAGAGACSALAGHLTSRHTAAPRDGLTAGMWAGTIAGLVLFVAGIGLALMTGGHPHSAAFLADFHASHFHDPHTFAIAATLGLDGDPPLLGAVIPLVVVPLLCAGLAAFGATGGGTHVAMDAPAQTPGPTLT